MPSGGGHSFFFQDGESKISASFPRPPLHARTHAHTHTHTHTNTNTLPSSHSRAGHQTISSPIPHGFRKYRITPLPGFPTYQIASPCQFSIAHTLNSPNQSTEAHPCIKCITRRLLKQFPCKRKCNSLHVSSLLQFFSQISKCN